MSQSKATYEGMFLLDAGNPDFQSASEPVRTILDRNEAATLALKPWDERRLAYEIQGRRRGLYVLSYFQVDPLKVADIEHDCQLDERIIRMLVLRRDDLTEEQINAETPATGGGRRSEVRDDDSDAGDVSPAGEIEEDVEESEEDSENAAEDKD
jgi:small subunit ribosomal protein S6